MAAQEHLDFKLQEILNEFTKVRDVIKFLFLLMHNLKYLDRRLINIDSHM